MPTYQDIFQKYGKAYPAGSTIFREGDNGEEMFIIQAGQVRISKSTNEGEKTLVILSEGDFFGEMAVIDSGPRSATATAVTETKCIVLNQAVFEQTMQNNIHIVQKILRNMSSRLREANKQIENLLVKDHNRRVANTLALIAHKHGQKSDKGISFSIPVNATEVANASGLNAELAKVKDILSKLAKAKVIRFEGDQIVVLSLESLEKFIRYLEMKEEFGE